MGSRRRPWGCGTEEEVGIARAWELGGETPWSWDTELCRAGWAPAVAGISQRAPGADCGSENCKLGPTTECGSSCTVSVRPAAGVALRGTGSKQEAWSPSPVSPSGPNRRNSGRREGDRVPGPAGCKRQALGTSTTVLGLGPLVWWVS